jgi:aldehyde dehydrogenase (NAD+)
MSSWVPDGDFQFHMPTKVMYGAGTHRELVSELADLGCSRAVIVTDRMLREQTSLPAQVEKVLGSACVGVFDGVEPDSRIEIVDAGASFAKDLQADCLVSVGGGSSMDTAECMTVVMTNGGSIVTISQSARTQDLRHPTWRFQRPPRPEARRPMSRS